LTNFPIFSSYTGKGGTIEESEMNEAKNAKGTEMECEMPREIEEAT